MHMSDALISPAVGGTGYFASAAVIGYSIYKIKQQSDNIKVPLMGVLGAFVFAAQMINFSIPGTGSSGHICGSLLLAVLLGPYAAAVVITSVLLTQALFFADGGLVALGCNIINMGLIPCFIAYPLVYKTIAGVNSDKRRIWFACIAASVIGLQLGAGAVVMETTFSNISELPFSSFVMLMLPIHLPIGLIEGMITASVLVMLKQTRPDILSETVLSDNKTFPPLKKVYISFVILALITGGIVSWFASSHPDGLEWAIDKTTGKEELETENSVMVKAAEFQEKTAFLPDYAFSDADSRTSELAGTSVSGIIGALITLLISVAVGIFVRVMQGRKLISENG